MIDNPLAVKDDIVQTLNDRECRDIRFNVEGDREVLRISKDGFYVRGKLLKQSPREAKIVYEAIWRFLTEGLKIPRPGLRLQIRKFRWCVRPSTSREGLQVLAYGVSFGYWPCLKAPFFRVSFHRWIVEVWNGYESYLNEGGNNG